MTEVVIVEAVRTAVGSFGGSLRPVDADDLAAAVLKAAVERANLAVSAVDEIVLGHCRQSSDYSNTARYAALKAGFPPEIPANTVMCACASGMMATRCAVNLIETGGAEVVIAGGTESMSNAPFYVPGARWGLGTGTAEIRDSLTEAQFRSQPQDIYGRFNMGMTAENVALKENISREDQDAFAYASQLKAAEAIRSGRFRDEIMPVSVPQGRKKPPLNFDTDEYPRETIPEKLAALPPAFQAEGGTVTAGNSSGRNDGASALLLMSAAKARDLGLPVIATIRGIAAAGVDPRYMGMGPVPATQKLLSRVGVSLTQIELIELNEAFAAQSLACIRQLGLEGRMRDVNVNGGAIALGHPIGSSGSRIIVTLAHEMRKRGARLGMATLCVAGGMGMATLLEAK
jgi:acetyl-CoA C-acetyltransferase